MAKDAELVDRRALQALMTRRDGPGLLRSGFQLAVLLASGAATVALASGDSRAWIPTLLVFSLALVACFPAQHESAHQTAFATSLLNEAVVWVCSVLMLQAPSFFRAFHWEHHRETQNREKDPEIASAPELLDGWPSNPLTYLANASGQGLMVGKASLTLGCAFLPRSVWGRFFPFLTGRAASRVVFESRLVVVTIASLVAAGLFTLPGFATLLLAWPIAHLGLGLYVMPEHTGLEHEGSQIERTRTIRSHPLLRWWMWNMPYHAEHHAYPGVPFHRLSRVHAQVVDELPHVARGYAAFHAEAIRRAFGWEPSRVSVQDRS